MRILHIVLGLEIGGLERFVQSLIERLSPEFKSFVVCLEKRGALSDRFRNVPIFELGKKPGLRLECIFAIRKLIRQYDINIVHTHNPSPHFYGSVAGFVSGVPVIHTKHGRNYPDSYRKIMLNRMASFLTSKIIPVSLDAANVCQQIEKIPPRKIKTILNGIDTSIYHRNIGQRKKMEEFGIPHSVPIVGVVGRLAPEKDHATLLKACKILFCDGTEFCLVIVGDGPLRKDLETKSRDLELAGHVVFTGMRSDIPDLLAEMDLFVLCSITEGIPLTLLEAMASSLPVVATRVGGNGEVVVENETGLLVQPGDAEALAEAMRKLLRNPSVARSMGDAGRERVVKMFDMRKVAKQYEELYRDLSAHGR